jgi:hypothetical protein
MVEQLRGAERLVVAPSLGLLLEGFGQCSSLRSEAFQLVSISASQPLD